MGPRKHFAQLEISSEWAPLEAWDLFVLRHQKTPNVRVHLLSAFLFWISPVLALTFSPWFWLGFVLSSAPSTISHYIYKDGVVDAREATSSLQVVYFSTWMAVLFLKGQWPKEVRLSAKKIHRFMRGEIQSVADPKLFSRLGPEYSS
jgi:hypothetical protein